MIKQTMTSPFTGGIATLHNESSSLVFRKETFNFIHQFYECNDTHERFTTTEIDEINILQATYLAMRRAVENMAVKPDVCLNDAVTIPEVDIEQVPIVKGDAKSVSIAAASIVAKVTRDRLMQMLDREYPEYGFAKHKGYGTKEHRDAIRRMGATPYHRKTFLGNIINTGG